MMAEISKVNPGWHRLFDDPIPLPSGGQFITLRDAANHITKLPKAEHDTPTWQAATEALIMAPENRGPLLHARVGMLRALNAEKPVPTLGLRKKRVKKYKIIGGG